MKITVYSLLTGKGLDTSTRVYASMQERDKDVSSYLDKNPDGVCTTDQHTLDLPAPEPVNAGLLAAAKSAISWLRVMGHDRTDSGALELSRALTRACKTAEAQPTAETPRKALDAPPASETSAALMRYADDLEQIVADLREAGLDGDALDTIDAISTALERMAEGALADDAERCASCGLPLPLEPSDDFGTCQCGCEGEE